MPILAAFLLMAMPAAAASPPSQRPDAADAAPAPPPEQLDFADEEQRMTLPVTIAGAGPYPFIVDTGAQRTVISRELAGKLGLGSGRNVRMTAMTGQRQVGTVIIPQLTVGTLGGSRIEAPALEARNLGADGLLGLDTLQDRALTIDFDRQTMTVARASRRQRMSRGSPDEIVITAKSVLGQLVVTEASYGDVRIRVILDTGSPVTMGNMALRKRVRHRAMTPISVMSVTGDWLTAEYAQIGETRIGGITFDNLPVAFADAAPFERFGLIRRPALLLGMDALRLFRRVDIDFANREVRFALPKGVRRI